MPYIKKTRQFELDDGFVWPENAGELNYIITKIIYNYWLDGTIANNSQNYQRINDIMGALEGAKLEFYRRIVSKYEDKKIKENGDVY